MNETRIAIRGGAVYLSARLYDRYFAGLGSVVLLRRGDDLLILPVRDAAAGGYLLKQRNSAGDRIVSAPDFFRAQGIDERCACEVIVTWDAELAALIAVAALKPQAAN